MAKRRKNYNPAEEEEIIREDSVVEEVQEYSAEPQSWFEENRMKFLAIIGVLALLIGIFVIYKYAIKAPKEKAAANAIYKAESQFARDSFALALENPGGGFEGFLDIIDQYNGTKAANLAKYYAGISYLNLGRYEDAIEYLKAYKANGDITPIMKNGALGDAYAETGELDQALSFYKKAANAEDNEFLSPYYLKKYGMLSQKQGKNDEALNAFKKIKEKYSTSSQGTDIDRYIAQVQ